jgi:superfamily II DNA or RNA helicase/phage anti-repressor protein
METLLQQGSAYEHYVKNIITDKYQSVWVWNEIPKEILLDLNFIEDITKNCDDIGCDILAKKHDNTYDYIQCKNYSTLGVDNTISICDLSGFYNFVAENDIPNPIVYYSGILSSQIQCRKKKIKYINLPYIKISNENIKPRDYQIEAFNTLDQVNRGILEMPCGTGKTLVSYLLSLNYNNVILISPLIATTEQLMIHYKNYYLQYKEPISFNTIHCQSNRNIENITLENKNIIGSTFNSGDIINKLFPKLNGSTIIFIDECHNLSNSMLTDTNNEIYKILNNNYKIIFISATPKDYKTEYQNIFGTTKYILSWSDAISNKYICKSEFYYPNSDKIIEYIDEIKFDKSIVEKTKLIYKVYFLLESIKTLEIKKCIVYIKTVKESEQFRNILKVLNIYFEFKLAVYEINYNIGKTARNTALNKFKNNSTKISIILNVHVLDEGIDIPECDSVFLTNPNNNPINMIQRISRANRILKGNNKTAKVLIWGKNQEKIEFIKKKIENYIPVNFCNINNKFINKNHTIENITNNSIIINNNVNKIKLQDYLKNNNVNAILIKFIDDFFSLYKYDTKEDEFVINLDVLAKWLDARKSTIKETLTNSYTKGIDYTTQKVSTGSNGRPSINVMLTPDCMKRICMVSRTKKAEEVRTYFIELEKHIDRYKDVIIQLET